MKKMLKGVAATTLFCFLTTQCVSAAPGAGIEMIGARELPAYLSIDVPPELGTVDSLYEAPSSANPQFILHIQNAHANYQAQMKIKQLLGYMNKKYGFKTIFVEGASEQLDADYLRLFPDQERNLKLCDDLAKQGELTGAELFLMEQPAGLAPRTSYLEQGKNESRVPSPELRAEGAVEALGIEQASLYKANYDALKKVFGAETDVTRFFKGFDGKLDKVASKSFTPETRQLIAEWKRFEQGRREFMPFVKGLTVKSKKILNVDLESLFAQVGWPQISRLLVIQQMEKEMNKAKGQEEQVALVKWLRTKGVSKELLATLENFTEGSIAVGKSTHEVSPREILENLAAEAGPKGFKFSDYPAFSLYAGYVTLRSELDPKVLFEEIEYLFTQMLDTLAKEPEQKALLALYRDGELLRKLLHLELTRAQWRALLENREQIAIPSLVARLKEAVQGLGTRDSGLVPRDSKEVETKTRGEGRGASPVPIAAAIGDIMPPKFAATMNDLFNAGLEFYDFAHQREAVFYKEMQSQMQERKITKAILITGGFHTDGMSDLFRENAVSYGIVTPRLSEKSDENLYRKIMLQNEERPFSLSYLEASEMMQDPMVWIAQLGAQGFSDKLEGLVKTITQSGLSLYDAVQMVNNSKLGKKTNGRFKLDKLATKKFGKDVYKWFPNGRTAEAPDVTVTDMGKGLKVEVGKITDEMLARLRSRGVAIPAREMLPSEEPLGIGAADRPAVMAASLGTGNNIPGRLADLALQFKAFQASDPALKDQTHILAASRFLSEMAGKNPNGRVTAEQLIKRLEKQAGAVAEGSFRNTPKFKENDLLAISRGLQAFIDARPEMRQGSVTMGVGQPLDLSKSLILDLIVQTAGTMLRARPNVRVFNGVDSFELSDLSEITLAQLDQWLPELQQGELVSVMESPDRTQITLQRTAPRGITPFEAVTQTNRILRELRFGSPEDDFSLGGADSKSLPVEIARVIGSIRANFEGDAGARLTQARRDEGAKAVKELTGIREQLLVSLTRLEMRVDDALVSGAFAPYLGGVFEKITGPIESDVVWNTNNLERLSTRDRAMIREILANGSDEAVLAKYGAKLSGEWGPKRTILVPLNDPVTVEIQVGGKTVPITYTTYKGKGLNIKAGESVTPLDIKAAKQPSVKLDIEGGIPSHYPITMRAGGAMSDVRAKLERGAMERHAAMPGAARDYTVNLPLHHGTITNKTFDYTNDAGETVSEKLGYVGSLITDQQDQRFYHQVGPKLYDFFDRWQAQVKSGSVTPADRRKISEELAELHGYFAAYGKAAREFNRDSFHSSLSPGNLNFIAAGGMEIPNLQDLDFSLPLSIYQEADRFGLLVNEVYMLLEGIHEFESPTKSEEKGRHPLIYSDPRLPESERRSKSRWKEVFGDKQNPDPEIQKGFYDRLNEMGLEVNFQKAALKAYFQNAVQNDTGSLKVTDSQGNAIGNVKIGDVLDQVMYHASRFNAPALDQLLLAPGKSIDREHFIAQVFEAEFKDELRPEMRGVPVVAAAAQKEMTRDQLIENVAEQAYQACLKAGLTAQSVASYGAVMTAQYDKAFGIINSLLDKALEGRESSILIPGNERDDRTQLVRLVSDIVHKRKFQAERSQTEVADLTPAGLKSARTGLPAEPAMSLKELMETLPGTAERQEARVSQGGIRGMRVWAGILTAVVSFYLSVAASWAQESAGKFVEMFSMKGRVYAMFVVEHDYTALRSSTNLLNPNAWRLESGYDLMDGDAGMVPMPTNSPSFMGLSSSTNAAPQASTTQALAAPGTPLAFTAETLPAHIREWLLKNKHSSLKIFDSSTRKFQEVPLPTQGRREMRAMPLIAMLGLGMWMAIATSASAQFVEMTGVVKRFVPGTEVTTNAQGIVMTTTTTIAEPQPITGGFVAQMTSTTAPNLVIPEGVTEMAGVVKPVVPGTVTVTNKDGVVVSTTTTVAQPQPITGGFVAQMTSTTAPNLVIPEGVAEMAGVVTPVVPGTVTATNKDGVVVSTTTTVAKPEPITGGFVAQMTSETVTNVAPGGFRLPLEGFDYLEKLKSFDEVVSSLAQSYPAFSAEQAIQGNFEERITDAKILAKSKILYLKPRFNDKPVIVVSRAGEGEVFQVFGENFVVSGDRRLVAFLAIPSSGTEVVVLNSTSGEVVKRVPVERAEWEQLIFKDKGDDTSLQYVRNGTEIIDIRLPIKETGAGRREARQLLRDQLLRGALWLIPAAIGIDVVVFGGAILFPGQNFALDSTMRSAAIAILVTPVVLSALALAVKVFLDRTPGRDVSISANFMRMWEESRRPKDWTTRSTLFVDRDLPGSRMSDAVKTVRTAEKVLVRPLDAVKKVVVDMHGMYPQERKIWDAVLANLSRSEGPTINLTDHIRDLQFKEGKGDETARLVLQGLRLVETFLRSEMRSGEMEAEAETLEAWRVSKDTLAELDGRRISSDLLHNVMHNMRIGLRKDRIDVRSFLIMPDDFKAATMIRGKIAELLGDQARNEDALLAFENAHSRIYNSSYATLGERMNAFKGEGRENEIGSGVTLSGVIKDRKVAIRYGRNIFYVWEQWADALIPAEKVKPEMVSELKASQFYIARFVEGSDQPYGSVYEINPEQPFNVAYGADNRPSYSRGMGALPGQKFSVTLQPNKGDDGQFYPWSITIQTSEDTVPVQLYGSQIPKTPLNLVSDNEMRLLAADAAVYAAETKIYSRGREKPEAVRLAIAEAVRILGNPGVRPGLSSKALVDLDQVLSFHADQLTDPTGGIHLRLSERLAPEFEERYFGDEKKPAYQVINSARVRNAVAKAIAPRKEARAVTPAASILAALMLGGTAAAASDALVDITIHQDFVPATATKPAKMILTPSVVNNTTNWINVVARWISSTNLTTGVWKDDGPALNNLYPPGTNYDGYIIHSLTNPVTMGFYSLEVINLAFTNIPVSQAEGLALPTESVAAAVPTVGSQETAETIAAFVAENGTMLKDKGITVSFEPETGRGFLKYSNKGEAVIDPLIKLFAIPEGFLIVHQDSRSGDIRLGLLRADRSKENFATGLVNISNMSGNELARRFGLKTAAQRKPVLDALEKARENARLLQLLRQESRLPEARSEMRGIKDWMKEIAESRLSRNELLRTALGLTPLVIIADFLVYAAVAAFPSLGYTPDATMRTAFLVIPLFPIALSLILLVSKIALDLNIVSSGLFRNIQDVFASYAASRNATRKLTPFAIWSLDPTVKNFRAIFARTPVTIQSPLPVTASQVFDEKILGLKVEIRKLIARVTEKGKASLASELERLTAAIKELEAMNPADPEIASYRAQEEAALNLIFRDLSASRGKLRPEARKLDGITPQVEMDTEDGAKTVEKATVPIWVRFFDASTSLQLDFEKTDEGSLEVTIDNNGTVTGKVTLGYQGDRVQDIAFQPSTGKKLRDAEVADNAAVLEWLSSFKGKTLSRAVITGRPEMRVVKNLEDPQAVAEAIIRLDLGISEAEGELDAINGLLVDLKTAVEQKNAEDILTGIDLLEEKIVQAQEALSVNDKIQPLLLTLQSQLAAVQTIFELPVRSVSKIEKVGTASLKGDPMTVASLYLGSARAALQRNRGRGFFEPKDISDFGKIIADGTGIGDGSVNIQIEKLKGVVQTLLSSRQGAGEFKRAAIGEVIYPLARAIELMEKAVNVPLAMQPRVLPAPATPRPEMRRDELKEPAAAVEIPISEYQTLAANVEKILPKDTLEWLRNEDAEFGTESLGQVLSGIVTPADAITLGAENVAAILVAYAKASQLGKFNLKLFLENVRTIIEKNPAFNVSSEPAGVVKVMDHLPSVEEYRSLAIQLMMRSGAEFHFVLPTALVDNNNQEFVAWEEALAEIQKMTGANGKLIGGRLQVSYNRNLVATARNVAGQFKFAHAKAKGDYVTVLVEAADSVSALLRDGMIGTLINVPEEGFRSEDAAIRNLVALNGAKENLKAGKSAAAENSVKALTRSFGDILVVQPDDLQDAHFYRMNNAALAGVLAQVWSAMRAEARISIAA